MKLTLDYVLQTGRGNERMFLCPVHDDHTPSASVNVAKGLWYCYTCHAKGRVDSRNVQVDVDELLDELDEILGAPDRKYTEAWLNIWDTGPINSYWLTRFTELAIRHFRLGWDYSHNSGTYPLRDSIGQVLGVVRRNLDDLGPKYRYPAGVKITDHLFNYTPAHRKEVYLVEGALDVVAAFEAGVDAFGIYGSHLSDAQVHLIDRVSPNAVVLCFDQDRSGREATVEAQNKLSHYGSNVVNWDPDLGKDLGELTIAERERVLDLLAL